MAFNCQFYQLHSHNSVFNPDSEAPRCFWRTKQWSLQNVAGVEGQYRAIWISTKSTDVILWLVMLSYLCQIFGCLDIVPFLRASALIREPHPFPET